MDSPERLYLWSMILVTGSTGLLGSHVLIALSTKDEPIRALYRNKKRMNRVKQLFAHYHGEHGLAQFNRIEWVEGDITDMVLLEEAMHGIQTVYHCAALVSFDRRDYKKLYKINRDGTANVVNTAISSRVKTLCHVSSTAAIGGVNGEYSSELTRWRQTPQTSGYAISKYAAEKEVWRGVEEGLDCVIVNPCVILGPGNWEESSLTIFGAIDKGLQFYTPGSNSIVDVRDVAEIMVRLTDSKLRNERYLCIGKNLPFKELSTQIATALQKTPPRFSTPRWLAEIGWRMAWIFSLFSGKRPALTKETVQSAFSHMSYSNEKVIQALDFQFKDLDDTIRNALKGRQK